jgi:hypothetical protein
MQYCEQGKATMFLKYGMKCSGLFLLACMLSCTLVLLSCGGGGGDKGPPLPVKGNVALYIMDSLPEYQQFLVTLTTVTLRNSGSKDFCTVPHETLPLDLSNLGNNMQLLSAAECDSVPYNRIDIQIERATTIVNGGQSISCSFASYKDTGNQQNALVCDPLTDLCTLQIRAAIRSSSFDVLGDAHNKLALDFALQDFTVTDPGLPTCAVSMKVSPLNAADMRSSGFGEAVNGSISSLKIDKDTFLLTRGTMTFTVFYGDVTDPPQAELEALLTGAEAAGHHVMVESETIDLATKNISAISVVVKATGP